MVEIVVKFPLREELLGFGMVSSEYEGRGGVAWVRRLVCDNRGGQAVLLYSIQWDRDGDDCRDGHLCVSLGGVAASACHSLCSMPICLDYLIHHGSLYPMTSYLASHLVSPLISSVPFHCVLSLTT